MLAAQFQIAKETAKMRKIFWTIIVLGTLNGSLALSDPIACEVWIKELDKRTATFNVQCLGSPFNSYCNREFRALASQKFKILDECNRVPLGSNRVGL